MGEDVYHLPAEENPERTNKGKICTRSTFEDDTYRGKNVEQNTERRAIREDKTVSSDVSPLGLRQADRAAHRLVFPVSSLLRVL